MAVQVGGYVCNLWVIMADVEWLCLELLGHDGSYGQVAMSGTSGSSWQLLSGYVWYLWVIMADNVGWLCLVPLGHHGIYSQLIMSGTFSSLCVLTPVVAVKVR